MSNNSTARTEAPAKPETRRSLIAHLNLFHSQLQRQVRKGPSLRPRHQHATKSLWPFGARAIRNKTRHHKSCFKRRKKLRLSLYSLVGCCWHAEKINLYKRRGPPALAPR
jgi:hypothetical protein